MMTQVSPLSAFLKIMVLSVVSVVSSLKASLSVVVRLLWQLVLILVMLLWDMEL